MAAKKNTNRSKVIAKGAPKPIGLYPHARQVGEFLFLSGIGSREPGTDRIPETFEGECHSVFKNVRTVLEEFGARWEDLVDVAVYLTDMERDFSTYNRVYAEYFKDAQPCRTTLGITKLPTAIRIELKCIAHPKKGKRAK